MKILRPKSNDVVGHPKLVQVYWLQRQRLQRWQLLVGWADRASISTTSHNGGWQTAFETKSGEGILRKLPRMHWTGKDRDKDKGRNTNRGRGKDKVRDNYKINVKNNATSLAREGKGNLKVSSRKALSWVAVSVCGLGAIVAVCGLGRKLLPSIGGCHCIEGRRHGGC